MQQSNDQGSGPRTSCARRTANSRPSRALAAACIETLESRRLLAADVPDDFVKLNASPITIGTTSSAPVSTGIHLEAGADYYFVASGAHKLASNPTRNADAQYYQRSGDLAWVGGSQTHLRVDGVSSWGEYDSSHVYGVAATGNGQELRPWVSDSNYADNAGTLSLDVYQKVELEQLKVTDAANADNAVTDDGGSSETSTLYVAEGEDGKATIDISGIINIDTTAARSKVLYRIDEPYAFQSWGNFASTNSVELTVVDNNRTWTVKAGVDQNGNEVLDSSEVQQSAEVRVLKADIDNNNDGDLDDSVDGADNFRPGYVGETQVLTEAHDQDFKVIVEGGTAGDTFEFALADVTSYTGRASNLGSETGPDIELGSLSATVTSSGELIMNAKNKDFGGKARIQIKLGGITLIELDLGKDTDGDGLPDWWENQHGGGIAAADDDDKNKSGIDGAAQGDLLPALDEFRGFMVTEGGAAKHVRTNPKVKDVFVSDALAVAVGDGGADALSLTSKADVNVYRVSAAQYDAGRKINFNGANNQRVVVIETGATGGGAGLTQGPAAGTKPSSYNFVRIRTSFFDSTVKLEGALNNAAQDHVFYDGTTDNDPSTTWQDGGRVKIGDEIIQYETALAPGSSVGTIETEGVAIGAAVRNIIVDGTAAFQQFRVGDEVVSVVTSTAGLTGGTVNAVAVGDVTVTVSGAWAAYPAPPAGEVFYVRIGAGAAAEWVSYTGVGIAGGTVTLTGVARGQFGTAARAHAAGTAYDLPGQFIVNRGAFGTAAAAIPVGTDVRPVGVFVNVTRGIAGTNAAAHAAGADIRVFATDDAYRETVAHEFGHAIGMVPHRPGSIMQALVRRGSFLGNGAFDDFLAASQGEIDAR